METNISLNQYQVLPRNQVLKLKYEEAIIYIRPGFIGESEPKTRMNEYWGIFFKIKDLEIYKRDSTNASNLESLPIDSSKINGEIEIIDIL